VNSKTLNISDNKVACVDFSVQELLMEQIKCLYNLSFCLILFIKIILRLKCEGY